MTDSRYLNLMQGEIDGENSPAESAALREYLSAHPEARVLHTDLLQLAGALDRIPAIDPPAGFKDGVLHSIRARRAEAGRKPLASGIFQLRSNALKYVYAVAAGLVLGALLTPFIYKAMRSGSSADISLLPGAMVSMDAFKDAAVVERLIQGEQVSGRVQLTRSAALLLVDLEIHSARKVDIALGYDRRHLQFKDLENAQEITPVFQSYADRLTWTHLDRLRCRILMSVLSGEAQSLRVQVLESDRPVYEGTLQLPGLTKAPR